MDGVTSIEVAIDRLNNSLPGLKLRSQATCPPKRLWVSHDAKIHSIADTADDHNTQVPVGQDPTDWRYICWWLGRGSATWMTRLDRLIAHVFMEGFTAANREMEGHVGKLGLQREDSAVSSQTEGQSFASLVHASSSTAGTEALTTLSTKSISCLSTHHPACVDDMAITSLVRGAFEATWA
ncbi:uncharacterized protein PSFLO_02079 [Pseudozyma flocculosa]|uniref:Uncharacterized protein n=1 Tax=Pseudozyma flocculosa TaxID=84751 RepID=A0A5C3EWL0_9BASI|nr:uncharacterized protein PSFLO_02079 [Pseudozyma flocculosa]